MRQVQALYNLAEIIEREGISLNEFYQELADILPKSWQYPEITGARIIIGESEFRTNNFVETEWRQSATIKANGLKAGRIDINYLEQKPKQDKGPFLSAERMLLDAIAERVGRVIEHKQLEETFKDSELRYRRFFETARDGILILDEETGTVVNVNPIMIEMMGFSREEFLGKKIWELGFLKDIIANRDNFEELKRKKYITYENLPLETAAGQMKEVEFVSNVYEVGNHKVIQCNVRDITIRRRMEIEREKYTKELVEKNTELERFTYTVSHDLKSPLVTIKTFLGYLAQDISAADKERIEKDVLFMNGAADKMGNLLRELLEMSRVGRMVNLPVEVTFRELVQETMTLVAGAVAEKGIQVKVSNDLVTLFGDRPRLIEIWQNLVENAVKFMPDQTSPQIDIGIEHPGNETIFFVRDNGLGIEPRYQSKLFNLFEKINAKTEGTGMGLAITKRIVELYRGRIWVESKGLGQGTVFFFTLPGALKDNGKGV
jgi:PAS domain S-box-containing protein